MQAFWNRSFQFLLSLKWHVRFDKNFKGWDPTADALIVAADLQNGSDAFVDPQIIADKQGWEPRRLNAAIAYLTGRRLIDTDPARPAIRRSPPQSRSIQWKNRQVVGKITCNFAQPKRII